MPTTPFEELAHNGHAPALQDGRVPRPLAPCLRGLCAFEMLAAILAKLPEKTGRTLAEWTVLVEAAGPMEKKARVARLKAEHELGTVTAQVIVGKIDGSVDVYEDQEGLVNGQYGGPKAALRPLYETLIAMGRALGEDVTVKPCRTYVTLSRRSQFAVIQPTTRTRIDLGLSLRGVDCDLTPVKNLGGGEAITHRIPVAAAADIRPAVRKWLTKAYTLNAKSAGSRSR